MKKKIKFPKRAKLITDGGFYKYMDVTELFRVIHVPLMRKITFASPETGEVDFRMSLNIEFMYQRHTKSLAFYKQTGVVNIVK